MTDELFRYRRPNEFMVPGNCLSVQVNAGQAPYDPRFPVGVWYCDNSRCPVRQVQVTSKYIGQVPPSSPPTYRCPECGRKLRFGHYSEDRLLVPVKPECPDDDLADLEAFISDTVSLVDTKKSPA